ncbi:MAG: CrcB family protein [Pseudomonadota bacterium]
MTGLYVAAGGALGAVLRWAAIQFVQAPIGTVVVNVVGSFLIGVAFVLLSGLDARWQLFVVSGVLGGFTTYSAYALDTVKLVEAGRYLEAGGYAIGTMVISLAAAGFAIWATRSFFS